MSNEGHYQPWHIVGNALISVGASLMYVVNENTSKGRMYGYSIMYARGARFIL